jgi:hypothetical protein
MQWPDARKHAEADEQRQPERRRQPEEAAIGE